MPILKSISLLLFLSLLFSCGGNESTKMVDTPTEKTSKKQARTADFNESKNAYFGDLHIHTSWSFDAFIYNTRTNPDDAYLFGKGEGIKHSVMDQIQLKRPLDFMAVTDHAEYMGVMKQMIDPNHAFFALDIAEKIRDKDPRISMTAFGEIGRSMAGNNPIAEINSESIRKTTWQKIVDAANKYYEPGKFTTFPAYEWTSSVPDTLYHKDGTFESFAKNMHRNVFFKSDQVPELPFSSFDSQNPEELWDWMDLQRKKGIELLAIPHNANMSNGMLYATSQYDGSPMTLQYINQRMRNEPINEVVQIKGQSMSHPILSPNDEFSDFELYPFTFTLAGPVASNPTGSYVREAYQNGLAIEQQVGANPFKFGLIGSSDGHNSAGATEEDNYFGKFGVRDGDPTRRLTPDQNQFLSSRLMSAAGIAGIWATENTREALFEAMERKETFATSGPRIKVRLFAGYDFEEIDMADENWVDQAYAKGVPMGGDIGSSPSKEGPSFLIWAVKDNESANLDRIQVIKAWVDASGKAQEKIFDVAWSDDRVLRADGTLPPVGNTVNVKEASYDNSIGDVALQTVWKDPAFNAAQSAMYYLRVLEIPTPRWSTYDAKTLGIAIPDDLNATIQERAWSSPIWYD